MLGENCGVTGAYTIDDIAPYLIYNSLVALQHRGQEACGIAVLKEREIIVEKSLGLVTNSFNAEKLDKIKSNLGIGHVRYSTTGTSSIDEAHPILVKNSDFEIALAFNGNIVNFLQIRKELKEFGYEFLTKSDGEVLAKLFFEEYKSKKDVEKAVNSVFDKLDGAYSVVAITSNKELIAFRDEHGFRPLNYGKDTAGNLLIASETVAFDINEISKFERIQPGELLIMNGEILEKIKIRDPKPSFCMFEYVYFSRPDSVFEDKVVYEVRYNLGKELANTYKTEADIIVPVPDTSRPAAEAISHVTGLPVVEGLIKNRYIGRTFIMPTQKERDSNIKAKLNAVKSLIRGKKVLLVDDSIVRGTTMKRIVELIRKAGAKSVEVWITCPPIISPCFYGIDIAIHGELIALNKSIEEIAKEIGADKLCYQTMEGLIRAIGHENKLCLGCLTGKYPTKLAQSLSDEMKSKVMMERNRYWEIEAR